MIYIIMHGYYSDWVIDGYFTDPEDAYSYCEIFNSNKKDIDDERYVVEVEEMLFVYDKSKFNDYCHKFDIHVFNVNGSYDFRIEHEGYFNGEKYGHNNKIKKLNTKIEGYYITIFLKKHDKEKAKKIAQDMLYEYLYNNVARSDPNGDSN